VDRFDRQRRRHRLHGGTLHGRRLLEFRTILRSDSYHLNDTGLAASTSYSYRVRATDAAGNLSPYSTIATVSTMAGPDTIPPNAPTNLMVTAVSDTQINLVWTASTDNVGVTATWSSAVRAPLLEFRANLHVHSHDLQRYRLDGYDFLLLSRARH